MQFLDHSAFWLRDAAVPDGVRAWDAKLPRTCETAIFQLHGVRLRIFNTHLDHEGHRARRSSALLIASKMRAYRVQEPEVRQLLCGDFNSTKLSEAYEIVSQGLMDVIKHEEVPRSTIHKWKGLDFEDEVGDGTVDLSGKGALDALHIDWMLCSGLKTNDFRLIESRVLTDTLPNGRYPSDHFPLSATFVSLPQSSL